MNRDKHQSSNKSLQQTNHRLEDECESDTEYIESDDLVHNAFEFAFPDLVTKPTIGKFEIVQTIAIRGQSTVFKAFDPGLQRLVAIKLYHNSQQSGHMRSVLAEGRALAQIDSDFVARCYGFESLGDAHYLVLEWVAGRTLSDYVKSTNLNSNQIRRIFLQLAKGVLALHRRQLIHCDIKPDNIIINEKQEPKLIDLGLVRQLSELGQPLAGTYSYMAPEVARNEPEKIGFATDVFGLGGVLYFLLTGQPVYDAESKSEIVELAKRCHIVHPNKLAGRVPRDLCEICFQCLQESDSKRITDIEWLISKLSRRNIWSRLF